MPPCPRARARIVQLPVSPLAGPRVKRDLTSGHVKSYITPMQIESITHKGLKRFFETGNAKGLVGDVSRLRKMLAYINAAETFDELAIPPNYGLHALSGDRAGIWAMTVTRNWRLTFRLNDAGAIEDMNLEDYHGS